MPNENSRISARAIVAGVLSSYALFFVFMLLAAGFGLWRFRISEIPVLGAGFNIWSLISWIVSVGIGSTVAAISAQTITAKDGMLQGFVTWAAATVIGCFFLAAIGTNAMGMMAARIPRGVYFGVFFLTLGAILGAMIGGYIGFRSETAESKRIEEEAYEAELRRIPRIG